MAPSSTEGLVFSFYLNTESGKTDDINADSNVNISYFDPKSTDWVSLSGTARINNDRDLVKKHWSSSLKAWFDKRGGEYTGDHNDPRVALLQVVPNEIRYWKADGKLKALAQMAKAAVSSDVAAPGQLIVITQDEISLVGKVHGNH